jgi:hypothetical protein
MCPRRTSLPASALLVGRVVPPQLVELLGQEGCHLGKVAVRSRRAVLVRLAGLCGEAPQQSHPAVAVGVADRQAGAHEEERDGKAREMLGELFRMPSPDETGRARVLAQVRRVERGFLGVAMCPGA